MIFGIGIFIIIHKYNYVFLGLRYINLWSKYKLKIAFWEKNSIKNKILYDALRGTRTPDAWNRI